MPSSYATTLTIRAAAQHDEASLRVLAALDSHRPIAEPILVAEHDGTVVAAISLHDGRTIADPFRATADAVGFLRARARSVSAAADHSPRRAHRGAWRRLARATG